MKINRQDRVDNYTQKKGIISSFSAYNRELSDILLQTNLSTLIKNNDKQLTKLLNGRASIVLQQTIPQDIRKDAGIFFTNHRLAEQIAEKISGLLIRGIKVADPACGAGDLLLTCAEYLPVAGCLAKTIDIWSSLISGSDLFKEFVMATKLRLILLAAIKSKDTSAIERIISESKTFPGLKIADILSTDNTYQDANCIVFNPPFGQMKATADCNWATGKIQIAAWLMERLIRSANPNQHIVALLPDVLRSGTRYEKWRNTISSMSSSVIVEIAGRFDSETDIDVFILHAIVRSENENAIQWPENIFSVKNNYTNTVSDYFNVCVGTIVPHRDPKEGSLYPYLHARNARQGQILNNISETIHTNRRVFTSPFVVLHRTSSPDDNPRCVVSIVNENQEVAIENHLIVLQAKNGKMNLCKRLIKVLGSQKTNNFLNQRIRCRHLTVPSINEIPWIEE